MRSHRVLLLGVEQATAGKLAAASTHYKIETAAGRSIDRALAAIEKVRPDLVCVPADNEFYTALNRALSESV